MAAIFFQNYAGFKIAPITGGTPGTYVDLSDHVQALTILRTFDELDVTAMGALGHAFISGLEASQISVDVLNDDSAGSVMATLNSAVGLNVPFKILQTVTAIGALTSTGTVSAVNPLYSGLILINKITPVVGKIGDVSVQSLSFTVSGAVTVAITGTW